MGPIVPVLQAIAVFESNGYERVWEEDEETLRKVLLVATSIFTTYIVPMCYVRSFCYGSDR